MECLLDNLVSSTLPLISDLFPISLWTLRLLTSLGSQTCRLSGTTNIPSPPPAEPTPLNISRVQQSPLLEGRKLKFLEEVAEYGGPRESCEEEVVKRKPSPSGRENDDSLFGSSIFDNRKRISGKGRFRVSNGKWDILGSGKSNDVGYDQSREERR
ncbi:hypothetical protein L5515_007670 [Caenorhabditis briggsae]|uniref:Uncharacterized protein n=1 Tax=Caenorhabditis briggsae TaxID=6238 RepID=A0AAE9JLJ0_CAEBR|nr:hypothetical protein L5515_007670 [Caenorhabditis briggsae]